MFYRKNRILNNCIEIVLGFSKKGPKNIVLYWTQIGNIGIVLGSSENGMYCYCIARGSKTMYCVNTAIDEAPHPVRCWFAVGRGGELQFGAVAVKSSNDRTTNVCTTAQKLVSFLAIFPESGREKYKI